MPNFTSALYLGFRHPSASLRPWPEISAGLPAAFSEPSGAEGVAERLAHLQGCAAGVLGASTLHLFWDLFGMCAKRPVQILFDADLYAIGRWGIERAAGLSVPTHPFRHLDPDSLRKRLEEHRVSGLKPIVVTDGFCPDCGRPAPLKHYIELLRGLGGTLVVDDTQALGIFGYSPTSDSPYGSMGGGMLRWSETGGSDIIVICSMAKAFGVPVALLSGSQTTVNQFKKRSQTRVHCSPPSIASIRAAEHALLLNQERGDELRLRLARLVVRFRKGAESAGLGLNRGMFPVQNLILGDRTHAIYLYRQLLRRCVQTVLRKGADGKLKLSFLINARQTANDIDSAIESLETIGKTSVSEVM